MQGRRINDGNKKIGSSEKQNGMFNLPKTMK